MHVCVRLFRDEGLLAGVEVVGGRLMLRGQVGLQHAGLYDCSISYHHVRAGLKLNITVKPQGAQLSPSSTFTISSISHQGNTDIQPSFCPPTVPPTVDLQTEDGVIECSAADGVPAANMSWLLPEGVSEASWFNFSSHNGSHTVKGVLLLPDCSPWERTATCVINHPAFEEAERRSVSLPVCGAFPISGSRTFCLAAEFSSLPPTPCALIHLSLTARPNITVDSLTGWENGEEYMEVACSVLSVAPAAVIRWHVGNSGRSISSQSQLEIQADGWVSARSSVRFPSSLYSGQNLSCWVEHRSLRAPEKRTVLVEHGMFLLSVGHAAAGKAACHVQSPLAFCSRSPPNECVSAETEKLSSLDCSV